VVLRVRLNNKKNIMSKNSPELQKIRNLNKGYIENMYFNKGLSQTQIANKFNISRVAVQNIFKKKEIKARTNAESQTFINHHREIKLNFIQEQLIYGSLLGDACLNHEFFYSNKTGKLLESYKICFYHSCKFKNYVLHKRSILGIGSKTKKIYKLNYRRSDMGSLMVGFSFCHTPTLKKIAKLCLNSDYKKSISQDWLNKIDWPGIAFWYQDDGSLSLDRKNGRRTLAFHTESFKKEEIILLRNLLFKFGLSTTLGSNNKNSNQQIILANKKEEVNKFIKNIEPYILSCMKYKIRTAGLFRGKKCSKLCVMENRLN
jgi:predicted DNA-binding protein YlxM (UPF0122 family)